MMIQESDSSSKTFSYENGKGILFDKIKENFPDVGISWFYDEPGMEFAGYLPN